MSNKVTIPDDVAEILRRSEVTENSLKLPGQLSRPDYDKVMKAISAAGGKWNKKAGRHVFDRDPRAIFADALATGKITHVKNETQAFYSPPGVVATLMVWAAIKKGELVLEPSSGSGAIADAVAALGGHVVCIELDPVSCGRTAMRHQTQNQDFLQTQAGDFQPFDAVVMNPPFTKGQDVEHVTHALKFLKPGGRLVAVMAKSFTFHSGKKYVAFRELLEQCGQIVEELNHGEFKSSGTSIDTVIIRMIAGSEAQ